MDDRDDGGPAFPCPADDLRFQELGMSLRDWFAVRVEVNAYSFPDADTAARVMNIDPPFDDSASEQMRFGFRLQAAIRYAIADAMLEARK